MRLLEFLTVTDSGGIGVIRERSLEVLFDFGELVSEDELLLVFL